MVAALAFMCSQTAANDVLLACDGRSRACRSKLEKTMEPFRNLNELLVVYSPTPRLGRRVSFASDNREVILISLPMNRTQLPTHERNSFNKLGEGSTHDSAYMGVPPAPLAGGSPAASGGQQGEYRLRAHAPVG